jgi:hypothetical protein
MLFVRNGSVLQICHTFYYKLSACLQEYDINMMEGTASSRESFHLSGAFSSPERGEELYPNP